MPLLHFVLFLTGAPVTDTFRSRCGRIKLESGTVLSSWELCGPMQGKLTPRWEVKIAARSGS